MLSTSGLYILYLSTGFTVGFGHCIGMCGPIVISLALNLKKKNIIIPQILYHYGRITTYALIGGIMGATGSYTVVAASMAGIQKGVMIFAGLLIVIMGFALGGWLPLGKFFESPYNSGGLVTKGLRAFSDIQSNFVYYPLGLLLGCGCRHGADLGLGGEREAAARLNPT